jgi:hypothetical protein
MTRHIVIGMGDTSRHWLTRHFGNKAERSRNGERNPAT